LSQKKEIVVAPYSLMMQGFSFSFSQFCDVVTLAIIHKRNWQNLATSQRVIEVEITTGNNVDKRVFISRIIMSPFGTNWPFVLHRHQFPIQVTFVIIINKNQSEQ